MRQRFRPAASPGMWEGPKPTLKMTESLICRVHHRRLEEFVATVYRMESFDFLFATGFTPGLAPEYIVDGRLPTTWNIQQQVEQIRRGGRTRNIALLLNLLAADGFIPCGRYVIDTKPEPPAIHVYTAILRKTKNPDSAECRAFKAAHQDEPAFVQRARTLDQLCLEAMRKGEAA